MCNYYLWLDSLGLINNKRIPVIIVLGNHDIYKEKYLSDLDYNYLYDRFCNDLESLHVTLLNNSVYEDRYVRFVGFLQPSCIYHSKDSLMLEKDFYNSLDINLFIGKNNKLNICVIHNPMNFYDKNIKNILKNFDLVFAGHMHNGLIISFIDRLFKGNWGLIDPDKKFFSKISRNCLKLGRNKYLVISGGITKLSNRVGFLKSGNILFPMELDVINIYRKAKK